MLSPLKTRKIWLEKLEVVLEQDYTESETEDYSVDLKIDIRKKSNALAFRIALGMTMLPSDGAVCRYSRLSVFTVGMFELPADTPDEVVDQLVPMNCLAILHGFARGVVAQVTGLNDGGPLLLPTVNFAEALQEKSRRKLEI